MKHSKRRSKPTGKILLLCVMVIALLAGAWFILAPQMEEQKALGEQSRLLESITEGDGIITLDAAVEREEIDFYPESEPEKPMQAEKVSEPRSLRGDYSADNIQLQSAIEPPAEEASVITGIGILKIEKIDLELPVVDGVSSRKLKVALGRVFQTAKIGDIGNAVIAGHRSYRYGQYLNRLGELAIGDVIEYQSKEGALMRFEVYDIRTIQPDDQSAFKQPKDSKEITLYTCTPIRVASHRLLIHAKIIEIIEEDMK